MRWFCEAHGMNFMFYNKQSRVRVVIKVMSGVINKVMSGLLPWRDVIYYLTMRVWSLSSFLPRKKADTCSLLPAQMSTGTSFNELITCILYSRYLNTYKKYQDLLNNKADTEINTFIQDEPVLLALSKVLSL